MSRQSPRVVKVRLSGTGPYTKVASLIECAITSPHISGQELLQALCIKDVEITEDRPGNGAWHMTLRITEAAAERREEGTQP